MNNLSLKGAIIISLAWHALLATVFNLSREREVAHPNQAYVKIQVVEKAEKARPMKQRPPSSSVKTVGLEPAVQKEGAANEKKKSVHALVLSKDRLGTIEIDVPRGVYPKKALLMGQEGTVKARVVFDSSGRVSSIHWLQVSSFNELNRAAESLIRQARLSGNLQSSVEQQLQVNFRITQ